MTVIFEDEALYTALKVEAARKGRYAKDIVAEAVREWLEAREERMRSYRSDWRRRGMNESAREAWKPATSSAT
ncbi:MAG: hypothetical protein AAB528_05020 [Chloroflexota bacterium]